MAYVSSVITVKPAEQHLPIQEQGTVLVTGGSGFIGRAVVAELRGRGLPVLVIDRAPLPERLVHDPAVQLIQGELTEPTVITGALESVPADHPVSAIVHLAAITSVLGSVAQPAETFRQNVDLTQRLLETARTAGIGRFVLASTNAVVGNVGEAVITEQLAPNPLTPYGATKAAAEMLALGYAGSYGLAACSLRFTNVYGPGMAAKDSFIPRMMRAAASGSTVQIYGSGEQRRDLVHVRDVARAVGLALDSGFAGRAIVGSGHSVSVLEMLDLVRSVSGRPVPADHIAAPEGEMPAVRVDLSGSAATIGYRPEIELREGLAEVWRDFCPVQ